MTLRSEAPELQLRGAVRIPQLGLGTWPLRGAEATRAIAAAIEVGYRLIDTAEAYENEEAVGEGIRVSGISREKVFITTKFDKNWHSRLGVRKACEASLRRLGLDYIDLYLIHWPNPQQDRYVEAFEGMMELVDAGLIRAAGVSNFKPKHLERLFVAGLFPVLNQIQLDPYRPRKDEVDIHRQYHIVTESWSPLDRAGGMMEEPTIRSIVHEVNRTSAQVVLRWHMQKGYIAVPKSGDPRRQAENLDIFDFELSNRQMIALDSLADPEARIEDSDIFGH
jgi:2,5-diketo-D-gluconate reductase A